jgi:hypothetical protein
MMPVVIFLGGLHLCIESFASTPCQRFFVHVAMNICSSYQNTTVIGWLLPDHKWHIGSTDDNEEQ